MLLCVRPASMELGRVVQGAIIEGTFQVAPAARCKSIRYSGGCSAGDCSSGRCPSWLHLEGPWPTKQSGLIWSFRIETAQLGALSARVMLDCDTGIGVVPFDADVRPVGRRNQDIVFFPSPFDAYVDSSRTDSLVRAMTAIKRRVHYVNEVAVLTRLFVHREMTIVLHSAAFLILDDAGKEMHDLIRELSPGGADVIVFAGEFFRGTVEVTNKLFGHVGIHVVSRSVSTESRPVCRGQPLFNVECCGPDIHEHDLNNGVQRVFWKRVSPIRLRGDHFRPVIGLLGSSEDHSIVAARPGGYLVVIGSALWQDLCCIGWPYDNDRLFANLLMGPSDFR